MRYQEETIKYEEGGHWWYEGRRKIINTILQKIIKGHVFKILDIGVGSGVLIKDMSLFGSVKGVDPDEFLVNRLKSQNIDVKIGDADNIPFEETFDLITMFDVLEHIEYDNQTLKNLKNYLNEDGKLFLTVPAFPFLWGHSDLFAKHYRRYTKKDINEKLNVCGYKVLRASYFNSILFPGILFAKLLIRLKHNRFNNDNTNSDLGVFYSNFINLICKFLFGLEAYYLRYFNFFAGSSILIIAKKE